MPGRLPSKLRALDAAVAAAMAPNDQEPNEATPLKPAEQDKKPTLLRDPAGWLRTLSQSYSWRLLAMVVCTNHLLKGFVAGGGDDGLVGKPIEFIFGELGVSAGRLQMLKAAAISPWALKPVVALLSDAVPILGYRKMPYVVATTLLALVGVLLVGTGYVRTVPAVVASLFLVFLQVSSVDVLVEAKQSEEVKEKAQLGPEFFTFTWLGINAGQVASVCVLGPVIYYLGPRAPYLVAAPFVALVLWPTLSNFLGERPVPPEDRGVNLRLLKKHPVLCSLTLMIGVLVMALIAATFLLSEAKLFAMALCFAAMVLTGFLGFVRWEIAGPVVFYFLLGMLSFNVDGAMFYFYTNSPEEYSHGPHFSPYFYTSGIGAGVFLGITVGFLSGTELFRSWSYRSILKVTIVLRALTQLSLLPVLLRWTAHLGVPDTVWVVAVLTMDSIVVAWQWVPKQVMGAHLTPQGVEATMLGLSAGTFNMATILSSYCGGFLLHHFGVSPSGQVGEAAAFDHLWKVQVLAALAPCTLLFLLPALIPAKTQTEPLLVQHRDSATHGSMFEVASMSASRWRLP